MHSKLTCGTFALLIVAFPVAAFAQASGPNSWQNDLTLIAPADWNYDMAAHLLERARFGGTPEEINALAKMTPAQAIARLVRFQGADATNLPLDHSGIHDPGLEPFPPAVQPSQTWPKRKAKRWASR